ncbi:MAG TPA: carbon-nitrogen hydrolase family protein [Mycobacteriales bacterium]|nr:carbon-nitrogen hydrolase family protein [Mycobacteriales bacterium]
MTLNVAVTQIASGLDKADNIRRLRALIEQAAEHGAELVVAPEAAMHDFGAPDLPLAPVAEPLDGPFVSALAEIAKRRGITVVAGMFEVAQGDGERDDRVFNTVVAVGADGDLIGHYRKQHLFDALGWLESDRLLPGDPVQRLVFQVADVTVGVMTCYDIRFPELARALADDGVDLIAVPSAWVAGDHKLEQWRALTASRAIENVCYVAGAVQCPPTYTGGSRIVDPWGIELAAADPQAEGIVAAEISAKRVAECRERMPSLANRRWKVEPR